MSSLLEFFVARSMIFYPLHRLTGPHEIENFVGSSPVPLSSGKALGAESPLRRLAPTTIPTLSLGAEFIVKIRRIAFSIILHINRDDAVMHCACRIQQPCLYPRQ